MRFSDKTTTMAEAIARIGDGATIMLGGFGVPGTPFELIAELVRQGPRGLTIIKNDANETGMGVDHLLEAGLVKRLVSTHIGLNPRAISLMNEGKLEVEFCAQGIMAERIRAGGAGLSAIITDIGLDTELAVGKQLVEIDGRRGVVETALRADFALLHAETADPFGNLSYAATARNFNPLMAMAADRVIAEAENVGPLGVLAPNQIHTPGPFVDHVVPMAAVTEEYAVVRR
ncbi:CoA transferase subunit A [Acidimangrovimonas pyrenivorans]|uniref:CoA transferase subunit A n=1 Tax=Acidimangrovimonas pyrenivorans TaxID=2030798 RepID=A0ABV7AL85_9RHOB